MPPILEKQPSGENRARSKRWQKRPVLRVKNGGGAPKGNRNALKHGAYTKERLEERCALRAAIASIVFRIHAAAAQSNLAVMGKRPKVIVTKIEL